jgi:hypothetical protein
VGASVECPRGEGEGPRGGEEEEGGVLEGVRAWSGRREAGLGKVTGWGAREWRGRQKCGGELIRRGVRPTGCTPNILTQVRGHELCKINREEGTDLGRAREEGAHRHTERNTKKACPATGIPHQQVAHAMAMPMGCKKGLGERTREARAGEKVAQRTEIQEQKRGTHPSRSFLNANWTP